MTTRDDRAEAERIAEPWLHGSDEHRAWLRSVIIPALTLELRLARAAQCREDAAVARKRMSEIQLTLEKGARPRDYPYGSFNACSALAFALELRAAELEKPE